MSFLARLSLANRGLVALAAVLIAAFGLLTVPSLKQQLLPSLEFPAAVISAPYPGAAPELVEQQVTVPIEDAIRGIDGLDTITSTSREGVATVRAAFVFGTDPDEAVGRLQGALGRLGGRLPQGVQPSVFAGGTDDLPAVVLAAAPRDGDDQALAARLEQAVLPALRGIDGVRDVAVTGARQQTVVVTADPAALTAAGVQPGAISAALAANGVTVPAGALTERDRTMTVQLGSPITSGKLLRAVAVNGARGPVPLGSVATVTVGPAPATSLTRTNGVPSLGVTVTAAPDGNAVQISRAVDEQLAGLAAAAGAELTVVFDQAPFVERSVGALTTEGLLGLVMAVLVILVFLLSVRSTLVTAVSIPLSVLVALIALRIGDHSLNLITLGALTIAVGRVVDDSIVVLENIKRHLSYGAGRRRAILTAVREVAGAVTASTLTTVAVFAPIALVGGLVGQLFTPFAVTVTVALLASLLVSLTVVPVLAYWFLRPSGPVGAAEDGVDDPQTRRAAEARELRSPLQRGYLPVVRFAIRRRVVTLAVGGVVLVATVGMAAGLQTNFLDRSGQDTLSIDQRLPEGASLASTDAAARRIEGILGRTDGVASYQVTVGGRDANPFAGPVGSNGARFSVALAADADAAQVERELRARFDRLGDAGEVRIGSGGRGGFAADQLAVVVRAADPELLAIATERVRQAMAATSGVVDVDTSLAENAPRLTVAVDRAAAARAGLTEAAVGQLVTLALRGVPAGEVAFDGGRQQVVLRLGAPPTSVDQLRQLPVGTPAGQVPLDALADVTEAPGPAAITRIDGNRSATVTGTATGANVGAASAQLAERLAGLDLPPGTEYEIGGVSAEQAAAFADLGLAVLAAIALVFLIMAATFRSLVQPLILLVSVPFAATGAVGLLRLTGTPLGVPALIGVLMLVGIVVTNAIVLLDLINQYRARGMGVREAVVEGGRQRLRPILMTAVATICALLPMALGLTGQGGFIAQPLAIVVIGGLVSSTLLTLVLVPTLYTLVAEGGQRPARRRAADPPAPPPLSPAPPAQPPAGDLVGAVPAVAPAGQPGAPVTALRAPTDQFEVLRLPRANRSPTVPHQDR